MQLTVFAVGRMKNGPERELTGRYIGRLEKAGPSVGLPFAGVTEIAESRTSDADRRKAEEGAHCLSLAEDRTTALVAFDEGGKTLSSEDFARWIARQRDEGRKRALFAIGGPDGHAPAVLERANLTVSLGRMTWPHQIARILVAEQLYRAVSILARHPYHRS